ncbi:lantibiotic dehydratase [Corallococcus caeni]|uniref:Lantibiotic dehydratase N-terminal domain-containing protein n=1 Tax=Corallococcus caeni TaxID=3082388 RepID=A0ABQ6QVG8_9BACT|nr:hypothetical protein ASNO1_42440 [Corallococcus sp. NO1]
MQKPSQDVAVFVRVAGKPTTVLAPLISERCVAHLRRLEEMERELTALRSQVADALFAELPHADEEVRPLLLALKRDCFNQRPIRRHVASPRWEHSSRNSKAPLKVLLEKEQAHAEERQRFHDAYTEDATRGHQGLLEQGRAADFLRALSLASPGLVEYLDRLYTRPREQYGKRERKMEQSLLRYLTRAAVKLSPYSTLTRVGLCVVADTSASGPRLLGTNWDERSLVRVKRYLLDQCRELLFLNPQVRLRLKVSLNDTLEELGPGHYRFLRPVKLEWNEAEREYRYAGAALVKVRLGGPLVAWLRTTLSEGQPLYSALRNAACAQFQESPEQVDAILAKLFHIGFLVLVPPWPSLEIRLEERMADFLRELASEAGLQDVCHTLDGLVALENDYAASREPLSSVRDIDRHVSMLFEQIKATTDPASKLRFEKSSHNYYEDVLVRSREVASQYREVARLDRATATELLDTGNLLWRLGNLYEPRHEFHETLRVFIARRWPGRTETPLLELFTEAQPLWEQFLEHLSKPSGSVFNPYALPEIASLQRLREESRHALTRLHTGDAGETRIPLPALKDLVQRLPETFAPAIGTCLFTQPADTAGTRWVVNRFFEGNGRFSSRFTAVLEAEPLQSYLQGFEQASRFDLGGEPVEVLDMLFTRGNTVNLHWPQTPRVLETPAESADLPEGRRIRLTDLFVRMAPEGKPLTVRDAQGQRYIPSCLSPLQNEYMPSILKFLDVFGPMVRSGFLPSTGTNEKDGVRYFNRLVVGRLVVRRSRWRISGPPSIPTSATEGDAFEAIHRWRTALGLPDQVYLIEKVTMDSVQTDVFKPQFIDFRSPALVALFLGATAQAARPFTLEEALPTSAAFPSDSQGTQWGLEFMLESLTLAYRLASGLPSDHSQTLLPKPAS